MFSGFDSVTLPARVCDKFRVNFRVTLSFELLRNANGHVRNGHISNAQHLTIPEIPDFSGGIS
jgi:hypothetical protein